MADELAPLAQKHVARPTHLRQRLSVRVATHRLLAAHLLSAGSIAQHGQVDEQVAAREFGFAVSDCALAAEVVSTVQTPTGGCHVLCVDGRTVVTLPHCVRPKSADFNQRCLHVNKITTYLFYAVKLHWRISYEKVVFLSRLLTVDGRFMVICALWASE